MPEPPRLPIVITLFNLVILTVGLAQLRPARAEGVAPVLRARALEIVDDEGRVRAEIKVLPAQPAARMPDGTVGYPEAVQLRLISSTTVPT